MDIIWRRGSMKPVAWGTRGCNPPLGFGKPVCWGTRLETPKPEGELRKRFC